MKTRQGFVSNSSSSSFVVIGTKFTKAIEAKLKSKLLDTATQDDEWLYDGTIQKLTGLEVMYVGDNERIIGDVLADVGSDGDYLENKDYTVAQLVEKIEKVQSAVGDLVDVKLMLGTRPS